jgi:molybdopterin synthase catalytic subunit
MAVLARLEPERLDPERELGAFIETLAGEGAVVSFVGLTRAQDRGGAPVTGLFLDHHPALTEQSLRDIATEAAARFEVGAVAVVHRCGALAPGEPIVFAAAASVHRRAAFDAADYLMDRLKTDAIFWKREDGADGSRWIEPTDADRSDRARWND